MVRGSYSTTYFYLFFFFLNVEITNIRKYQISHNLYHSIPSTSSFYCACASHICEAVLFSVSPPHHHPLLSYIWVLHMTPTHQMQLPDLICDLLTSCIWNHRLGEELWHWAGDGGVPHSRFLQENPWPPPQLQLRTTAFLVIRPVCLGGIIFTALGSRSTWGLILHIMTDSGNPMYYSIKKIERFF